MVESTEYDDIKRRHATGNGHDPDGIICESAKPHSIASIPPRSWAYGHFLLFGAVSAIGAVDGGGKGAMATAISLSMITGQQLIGERVWRPGPVAIITYEDDEVEWRRRIAAACLHYHVEYEKIIGSFHFIRRPGGRVQIAARGNSGVIFPDGQEIIDHLKRIGAVLLILDPFNHAHSLEDGNSNALMRKSRAS